MTFQMSSVNYDTENDIIDNKDDSVICLTFSTTLRFDNLIEVIIKLVRLIEINENKQIERLNIVLSSDIELAKLNSKYRNIYGPTDVLTFNLTDDFDESKLNTQNTQTAIGISGDIYISADRVIAQSIERSVEPKDEFLHLLAHGLLHLFGWTHEDDVSLSKIIQTGEKYITMSYHGN